MMLTGTATSQQSFPVLPGQLIPEISLEDQGIIAKDAITINCKGNALYVSSGSPN